MNILYQKRLKNYYLLFIVLFSQKSACMSRQVLQNSLSAYKTGSKLSAQSLIPLRTQAQHRKGSSYDRYWSNRWALIAGSVAACVYFAKEKQDGENQNTSWHHHIPKIAFASSENPRDDKEHGILIAFRSQCNIPYPSEDSLYAEENIDSNIQAALEILPDIIAVKSGASYIHYLISKRSYAQVLFTRKVCLDIKKYITTIQGANFISQLATYNYQSGLALKFAFAQLSDKEKIDYCQLVSKHRSAQSACAVPYKIHPLPLDIKVIADKAACDLEISDVFFYEVRIDRSHAFDLPFNGIGLNLECNRTAALNIYTKMNPILSIIPTQILEAMGLGDAENYESYWFNACLKSTLYHELSHIKCKHYTKRVYGHPIGIVQEMEAELMAHYYLKRIDNIEFPLPITYYREDSEHPNNEALTRYIIQLREKMNANPDAELTIVTELCEQYAIELDQLISCISERVELAE